MGFMDKLGNMFGGDKKPQTENVKGPSLVLRENGVDPSNLKFAFNADGSLGVSGQVHTQAESDNIAKVLKGIPNVTGVSNKILVVPATPTPAPVVESDSSVAAPGAEVQVDAPFAAKPEASAKGRTYTVKSGDTLSAIAQEMYGSASKYQKIFEANTDQLKNPDKIRPGQVLVIPDLDD